MNESEAYEWAASLTETQRQHLGMFTSMARAEGFKASSSEVEKESRLKKWLIPLAVFGVPVGMLIQRYLIVIG